MRPYERLSSWQFSVVLTTSGALYYIFLVIWGAKSPPHVVRNIAGLSPFVLLYLLLLINTLLCILHRLPTLMAQMRADPVFLPQQQDWERTVEQLPLQREKWKPIGTGYARIYHRFSALGTILLHGALFFLAAGFFLTLLSRYEGRFFAAAGEKLLMQQDTYYGTSVPSTLTSSLPAFTLDVRDIKRDFWRNELLFTKLVAEISINQKDALVAINKPVFLSPGTSLRLSSFGYAPSYRIVAGGVPLEEGAAKMRIFPPGEEDYFRSQHFPHRIYVKFYPDWMETKEGPISRSMNLHNPRLVVDVYRGKIYLGEKTLAFDELFLFEGITLSFTNVIPMAEFTVIRDLGFPLILLAFVMTLVGLTLRLPGKRGELLVEQMPNGRWMIKGKNISEFMK